jgi:glycosyltransferase 2 family protein
MKIGRHWIFMLKAGLGFAALWMVIHSVSWDSIQRVFAHVHMGWLIATLIATALEFVVSSLKVGWMAQDPSWTHQLKIIYVKTFMNQVLPGGMGGEAARIYFLGRFLQSPGKAIAILFMDRWSGLCGQFIWSGIGLLVFLNVQTSLSKWANSEQALAAGMIAMGALGWFSGPYCIGPIASRFPLGKWIANWNKLDAEAKSFVTEIKVWTWDLSKGIRLLGWVALNQGLNIALVIAASKTLGGDIHPLLASAIMLLGALSSIIPLTLGNLGVQEAFFAFGYHAAGLNPELGIGVSLLFRLIQIGPVGFGLYYFLKGFRPAD